MSGTEVRKATRDGLPPGPPGVEFDTAVDEVMEVSFLIDRYEYEQVPVRADTLQVLAFVIRWMIDENTGNAPNLYDRMKTDFEAWQQARALVRGDA